MNDLRTVVRGAVLLPAEDGFERASRAWNLTVDQPVAAVVEAADAEDVAALVRYARRAGLTVMAQPNGHGAAGASGDVILLRTGRLAGVAVDSHQRLARVEAGARWGQVQRAAAAHNLTGLPGSFPGINVVGYTLGGGLSWFSRRHGWACDSVNAFEIVDADGDQVRVTSQSDPDLFWALRGGGGDFALVTAMEFDLYPAAGLYGGRVMWPDHRTGEVFEAFREITDQAPAELSVWFHRFQLPDAPPMVAVDAAYLGEAAAGKAALAPLDRIGDTLVDKRCPLSTDNVGEITTDPPDPAPTKSRADLLTDLDEHAVEILLGEPVAPLVNIHLRHLGGALAEDRPDHGACGPVTERYLLYMLGLGLPGLAELVAGKQTELIEAFGDRLSGRKPYTFLAPGERAADAFDRPTLAQLQDIKREYDPQRVFRASFPVLR